MRSVVRTAAVAALMLLVACNKSRPAAAVAPVAALAVAEATADPIAHLPFRLVIERRAVADQAPLAVDVAAAVTITNPGGPLSGTTTRTLEPGATTVTFDDLIVDDAGPTTLVAAIQRPDTTALVWQTLILRPLRLRFVGTPKTVMAPDTFAVTVAVFDAVTGAPTVADPPIDVVLDLADGGEPLQGKLQRTSAGTSVRFDGLRNTKIQRAALLARADNVALARSEPIDFDAPRAAIVGTEPARPLVRGSFALTLAFTSTLHPGQRAIAAPMPVTARQLDGNGTLRTPGSTTIRGREPALDGFEYDALGPVRLAVSTPFGEVTATVPIAVQVTADDPTIYCAPSRPMPPVTLTIRDGRGEPFAVDGAAGWTILRGNTVLQNATVPVQGASQFVVAPAALDPGTYRLEATVVENGAEPLRLAVQTLVDFPGPIAMLRPGREGSRYAETLAGFVGGAVQSFVLPNNALPVGLAIDASTGAITGAPAAAGVRRFTAIARVGSTFKPIRCTLPIFSADEHELVAGQDFGFGTAMPYLGAQTNATLALTSTYDNSHPNLPLRIHHPSALATIATPMPLLVFHHGRGFDHTEYNDILGRIARWGFVCVSSGDYYSFFGNGQPGYSGAQPYEQNFAEGGMQSASGSQEAMLRYMIVRNRTPGDPFFGKIDEDRLFVGGHSRGGGATHASQTRGLTFAAAASPPQIPVPETFGIAGYLALMPFDLWYFSTLQPPQLPPVPGGLGARPYSIPRALGRIPGLIVAAENDGDLTYPFADQLCERRTTQNVFLTIWGATHNQTGDAHGTEAPASINAPTQRNILVQWMAAFLLRYGYDRIDLDGHLFGGEYGTSSRVGHVGFRDLATRRTVLDAQNGNVAQNSLQLPTAATGVTASLVDPYPLLGNMANAQPRALQVLFAGAPTERTLRTSLGALDVTGSRSLVFELRQNGPTGFNWLSIDVRLTDADGQSRVVTVYDNTATPNASPYLPVYPVPGHTTARPLARFVQVDVPLSAFAGIDLARVDTLAFEFRNVLVNRSLLLDDIRFE